MEANDGSKAKISCWELEKGDGRLKQQKSILRKVVKKAIGKALGVDEMSRNAEIWWGGNCEQPSKCVRLHGEQLKCQRGGH